MSDSEFLPPQPTIRNSFPDDTIRIMLATDNHIGYLERDPIRGQDSINTFKEILQLAVKNDVDFILLAGDLFHENRPSRDCLYQVMALLREYTLGDKPVEIELMSDPDEGKAAGFSFPAINYEDGNFNVGIPVFSIHGNHDDPQGAGPEGALCALDMLSVSGLVNYIGKLDLPLNDAPTEGIAVRPVLLRKGNTHLGMYGIGNVKDARMHFELRSNRVRMYMPRDKENWFNLMLLHQNRVRHGPQESVPEGMFDDNIDLVIWGHEHDCRIVPEPVAGKRYYISQPGSSVATSLAEGESLEKHVALVKIQGKEFELTPIPLRTVRPFVMDEVVLTEAAEEEGFDINDQMEVTKFLKVRVNEMIAKANALWDERNVQAVQDGLEELPRMLPLVRLKVDTTAVSSMSNPIRFGQEFQGKIANPRDVLTFHRAKQTAARRVNADEPISLEDDEDAEGGEKLVAGRVRMRTLVQDYLKAQELQLLGESGMANAIQVFVEKDDIHAIQTHVNATMKGLMKGVQAKGEIDEDDLDDVLEKVREQHEKDFAQEQLQGSSAKGKGRSKATSDAESMDSMMMEMDGNGDDLDSDAPVPTKGKARTTAVTTKKKAAPAKKATSAVRGRKKVVEIDSDDEEDDDEEDEEPAKPVKRTNRAAVLSQATTTRKAPAKRATPAPKAKQSTLSFEPSQSRPARTSTRAAAGRARGKMAEVVDLDSD